jgi:hypothetical protein
VTIREDKNQSDGHGSIKQLERSDARMQEKREEQRAYARRSRIGKSKDEPSKTDGSGYNGYGGGGGSGSSEQQKTQVEQAVLEPVPYGRDDDVFFRQVTGGAGLYDEKGRACEEFERPDFTGNWICIDVEGDWWNYLKLVSPRE